MITEPGTRPSTASTISLLGHTIRLTPYISDDDYSMRLFFRSLQLCPRFGVSNLCHFYMVFLREFSNFRVKYSRYICCSRIRMFGSNFLTNFSFWWIDLKFEQSHLFPRGWFSKIIPLETPIIFIVF